MNLFMRDGTCAPSGAADRLIDKESRLKVMKTEQQAIWTKGMHRPVGDSPVSDATGIESRGRRCGICARLASIIYLAFALGAILLLSGCGGGDSPTEYTIGGVVTGLKHPSMQLVAIYTTPDGQESNEVITVTADVPFRFTATHPSGTEYFVSFTGFLTNPTERCSPSFASGIIDGADIDNIQFTCSDAYTLSFNISGLQNTPKAYPNYPRLEVNYSSDNGSGNQPYTPDNGTFQFDVPLFSGDSYEVVIAQQPSDPPQACTISNASGTVTDSDISNINVNCGNHAIGGTVEGLVGSGMQLSMDIDPTYGGTRPMLDFEVLDITANGDFQFTTLLPDDTYYTAKIYQGPTSPEQPCRIENASGTITSADLDIDNIRVICPQPKRSWRYDATDLLGHQTHNTPTPLGAPEYPKSQTGGIVDDRYDFRDALDGGISYINARGGNLDPFFATYFADEITDGVVHSSATGMTYWVAVESPQHNAGHIVGDGSNPDVASHYTRLETLWHFKRTAANARLTFEISDIALYAINDGPGVTLASRYGRLLASAELAFMGFKVNPADGTLVEEPFYFTDNQISMTVRTADPGDYSSGVPASWDSDWVPESTTTSQELWEIYDFMLDTTVDAGGRGNGLLENIQAMTVEIDLSAVNVGEEFYFWSQAEVHARNSFSPEGASYAYLRDPATFDPNDPDAGGGGMRLVAAEGLTQLEVDDAIEQPPSRGSLLPAEACADLSQPQSTLAFDAAEYYINESGERLNTIKVIRSDNPAGVVSARVTLTPGTATEILDYLPEEFLVRFNDGSVTPRRIDLQIVDDQEQQEPNQTLTLTLTDPSGCAVLGAQSTATVIIVDNDVPPPATYTVGGQVSGLVGSGLVLWDSISGESLNITASGAFTFTRSYATGTPYHVQITAQPDNPAQNCTVTNGDGTINAASVTNIVIACTTLTASTGLDPDFGDAGKTLDAAVGGAIDMVLLDDGRILVLSSNNTVSRYGADGILDTSFGSNGHSTISINGAGRDYMTALAVQPDDMIVVVGYTSTGINSLTGQDFAVSRLNADGSPDVNFGGQGTGSVVTDFALMTDRAWDVAIQPDGAIVVAGHAMVLPANGNDFAAARYDSSGALDTTFGGAGLVANNIMGGTDLAYAVTLQADGRIVLAGRVADGGGDDPDFGLVRYDASGNLDTTFSQGGLQIDPTTYWDEAADLLMQADGKIIAVGKTIELGVWQLDVRRYNVDGSLDTSFGSAGTGQLRDDSLIYGNAVALADNGDLLVVGSRDSNFGIVRYDTLGQRVSSFGADGVLQVDFYAGLDDANAVAIQPDGRILTAGEVMNGTTRELGLIRIIP